MSIDNERANDAIVFSMIGETVWASWPGRSGSVELGSYDVVTFMMRDFLDQCDLGERLALRQSRND